MLKWPTGTYQVVISMLDILGRGSQATETINVGPGVGGCNPTDGNPCDPLPVNPIPPADQQAIDAAEALAMQLGQQELSGLLAFVANVVGQTSCIPQELSSPSSSGTGAVGTVCALLGSALLPTDTPAGSLRAKAFGTGNEAARTALSSAAVAAQNPTGSAGDLQEYGTSGDVQNDVVNFRNGDGADMCTTPSTSLMKRYYKSTSWRFMGLYVGGADASCPQAELTKAFVQAESSAGNPYGFAIAPIWVGPQLTPCNGIGPQAISTDSANDYYAAYAQGRTQADQAAHAMSAAWFGAHGFVVYYDLEGYALPNVSQSTLYDCEAAAAQFVRGWSAELHHHQDISGMYGSACSSAVQDWYGRNTSRYRPDDLFVADQDGNPNTSAVSCLNPSGNWKRRIKQWLDTSTPPNGVPLPQGQTDVDLDCVHGAQLDGNYRWRNGTNRLCTRQGQ